MTQATLPVVHVERRFEAPPADVYALLTNIEVFAQIIAPPEVAVVRAVADLHPGGSYEIALRMQDGDVWTVRGTYRQLVVPERIAFGWRWVEDDPQDEQETLVTIVLTEVEGATELALTHEGFTREQSRASHEGGWAKCLDVLAARLGEG